jgi:HlyD family secretion protein
MELRRRLPQLPAQDALFLLRDAGAADPQPAGACRPAGLYFQSRPVPDSGVLRVSGNIEMTDAEVSFKIAGRVVERSVSEGESVKAEQSVARLDTSELAQEVALRSAEVRAAEASLAELVTGSRPEEIAQAEAVVRRMQADVARARADFKRLKKLYEQDNVSGRTTMRPRAPWR